MERGRDRQNYDWVTGFEKERPAAKVNVSARRTDGGADEPGADLLTTSGDASRLIAGGKVRALNPLSRLRRWSRLPCPPGTRWTASTTACPTGGRGNIADAANTKVFPKAPDSWSVPFEEQTLAGRRKLLNSGAGAGVLTASRPSTADAALYLGRPTAGARYQAIPHELNEDQCTGLDLAAQAAPSWWDATGTTPSSRSDDFKNEGGGPPALAVPGQYPDRRQAAHRHDWQPRRGHQLGRPTSMMCTARPEPHLCPAKWLEHSLNNKLQGDPRLLVPARCPWCRPPAEVLLLGKEGARPAARQLIGALQRTLSPSAEPGTCDALPRWVSDLSPSWGPLMPAVDPTYWAGQESSPTS